MNGLTLSSLPVSELNNNLDLVVVVRSLGQGHFTNCLATAKTLQPYTSSYAKSCSVSNMCNYSLTSSYLNYPIETSSYAGNSLTSSYSLTSSLSLIAIQASSSFQSQTSVHADSATTSDSSVSASYSVSSSYSKSSSYSPSSSYSYTASYALGIIDPNTLVINAIESTYATSSLSSSFASASATASYISPTYITNLYGPTFVSRSALWQVRGGAGTTDWNTIDLSSYIPVGIKTVMLEVEIFQSTPDVQTSELISRIQSRPSASSAVLLNIGELAIGSGIFTAGMNQAWAPISDSRTIDFRLYESGAGNFTVTLVGYWNQPAI